MDGSEDLVLLDIDGGVATVTLNRPARHNSLVPELLEALIEAFGRLDREDGIGAAVLRANGPSFSTGGDIAAFLQNERDLPGYAYRLVGCLNDAIVRILDCPVPVVAAVNGQVTGGSLGLVLAADIVVVTERASFRSWYAELGFSPDGGWAALLPDLIGRKRAAAVQLLNREIDAETALDWGIATDYADSGTLDETVARIASELCGKKPGALACARRLLRPDHVVAFLDAERQRFVGQIETDEALEAMRAFVKAGRA